MTSKCRHTLINLSVLVLILMAPGNNVPAQENGAINISRSDFQLTEEDLMSDVERLEAMAATSVATAAYARAYEKLHNDLRRARPPVAEWSENNRDRLRSLSEPSDAAWNALEQEERRNAERARARTEATLARQGQALELRREADRLRLAEERLEIDAAEKEARIRELEARAEYYEDASRYYSPYYGSLWWSSDRSWRPDPHLQWQPHKHRSIRPHRPHGHLHRSIRR